MEKRPAITVWQLFSLLFVSRMVVSLTYGNILIGDSDIWDHMISILLLFLLTFLLVIPTYYLFLKDKKMNILDNSLEAFGKKISTFIIIIYIIYYFLISFHTLVVFSMFIFNAVNPKMSIALLSILLLSASCYGAYKGLEALSRTSGFIIVATVFAVIFLWLSLSSGIESINYKPLMLEGSESVVEGLKFMISQSSCIPALGILLPMAKGNHKKGIIFWNLSVCAVFGAIVFLIVGTMGDFASTQMFPLYTAAGIGKFGSLKHLDSIYLGIWISGIFLKLSLFLLLMGEGVKKIAGEKIRKRSVIVFGIILSLVTFFIDKINIIKEATITDILLIYLLVVSVVVPLILIVIRNVKNRKKCITIEKY